MHLHLVHEEGFTLPFKLGGVAANYCVDYDRRSGTCREYQQDTRSATANSMAEAQNAIDEAAGGRRRIRSLSFHSHGNEGYLAMGINRGNVGTFRSVCSRSLMPDASVSFVACRVARGDEGRAFMRAAAEAMLPVEGGAAIAMESNVYTFPVGGTRAPAYGRVVVARKDPDGSVHLFRSGRGGGDFERLD